LRKRNKLTINTFALSGTLIPDFFYISPKYAFMRHGISLLLICLLGFLVCPAQTPNQTLNLSFENTDDKGRLTGCRFSWNIDDYFSYKDDSVRFDGKNSIRLEKDLASTKGGFGAITFTLPTNFKGSEITLKGYIKTERVEGYAGLWLRTVTGNVMVDMKNMSENGVTGTQEWKQYNISLRMNEEVTGIYFGGLLAGKGKSWFDKLELLIDNKPIGLVGWIPDKTNIARKELTTSGVTIDSLLSPQQVSNLYMLGKVWGFLKYHHPEVAKGNYNFDSCLFNVMPAIIRANNTRERDDILQSWINTLGNENEGAVSPSVPAVDIHTKPRLAWLSNTHLLSDALSARLMNIYDHRNSSSNFYVHETPGVGNLLFDKEAIYKSVPASDDGFRMLALFRYWNIIEYFFPYKHLLNEDWNDVLKEFIPSFASNRSGIN